MMLSVVKAVVWVIACLPLAALLGIEWTWQLVLLLIWSGIVETFLEGVIEAHKEYQDKNKNKNNGA